MKRLIISILIAALFIPIVLLHAQGNAIEGGIWIEPKTAKAGDDIELQTFIYNQTTRAATVTVSFTDEKGAAIGESELAIPAQTAKIASVKWKMPYIATMVTATITKAADANKKTITELAGVTQTNSVGGAIEGQLIPEGVTGTLKGWIAKIFGFIEPWRQEQAEKFTAIRNKARVTAGVATVEEIGDALAPEAPGGSPDDDLRAREVSVPFGAYITLIYSTSLASLFSSIAIFYITLVLGTLLVLRMLVTRFLA